MVFLYKNRHIVQWKRTERPEIDLYTYSNLICETENREMFRILAIHMGKLMKLDMIHTIHKNLF